MLSTRSFCNAAGGAGKDKSDDAWERDKRCAAGVCCDRGAMGVEASLSLPSSSLSLLTLGLAACVCVNVSVAVKRSRAGTKPFFADEAVEAAAAAAAVGVFVALTTVEELPLSLSLSLPLASESLDSESDEKMGCGTALIFFAGVTRGGFFDAGATAGAAAADAAAVVGFSAAVGFVPATRARVTRVVTFAVAEEPTDGCSVVSCESLPSGAVEGTS